MKSLTLMFLAGLAGTATAQPGAQPAPAGQPAPAAPVASPAPTTTTGPSNATGGEVLTLSRAIEIAMRQQPSLRQSRAQLEAAQGRVDLSRVSRSPTVTLSASLGVGSTLPRPCAGNPTATCGGFFDPTASSGLAAQASWRIYDFGLTDANIHAAELNADAAAAAIGTTTLDIRTDVEVAYLEAVARRRLIQVAEATVRSEDAHLDQARRFVAAQAKDPIEVAQATSRDANAKSALAQAQSNEAIALANLRSAIGWSTPPARPPWRRAGPPRPTRSRRCSPCWSTPPARTGPRSSSSTRSSPPPMPA